MYICTCVYYLSMCLCVGIYTYMFVTYVCTNACMCTSVHICKYTHGI